MHGVPEGGKPTRTDAPWFADQGLNHQSALAIFACAGWPEQDFVVFRHASRPGCYPGKDARQGRRPVSYAICDPTPALHSALHSLTHEPCRSRLFSDGDPHRSRHRRPQRGEPRHSRSLVTTAYCLFCPGAIACRRPLPRRKQGKDRQLCGSIKGASSFQESSSCSSHRCVSRSWLE